MLTDENISEIGLYSHGWMQLPVCTHSVKTGNLGSIIRIRNYHVPSLIPVVPSDATTASLIISSYNCPHT